MDVMRRAMALLVCVVAAPALAQTPANTGGDDLPRVFLDCQANGCDTDYLRIEIAWLNFVRDRTLAQVHILATSQGTSSGGTELTVAFLGLGPFGARADTIVQYSEQGATFDSRRELLRRVIGQGMMRYVGSSPLSGRLSIQYDAPTVATASTGTRGARDRWNLWVFRVSGNTWFNGEEAYRSSSFNGSVRASRTTAHTKFFIGANADYNEDHYNFPDEEEFSSYRHGYSAELLFARSLGEHWSAGLQVNAASRVRSNLDLGVRIGPSLEYDLFPYSQSTRRQLIVRYSVGMKALSYDSITIFDKTRESLPDHRLVIAADATQPWGGMGGSATFSQYLSEPSLYRFNVSTGVNWRVARGLNLNFDMGYAKIRDQINLRRGSVTEQEVLLRLQQLATGYEYWGSVGLSYTFGSIFQNVVNPRFTRNTGGWFF
jgi:hypothetical protein